MKKSFLLFIVIAFISAPVSFSQGLKFGVGGGLTSVQSPDSYTNDVSDDGLGFGTEYHFGVKAKLSLPAVPIIPIGYVNYHLFQGTGESFTGTKDIKQNLLTIAVGIEYNLMPGPVNPYASLDIQFNSFGDLEGLTTDISGQKRTGIGLGAGVELGFIAGLSIDVSAKYNWINLMGQESGEESMSTITLNATILFGGS